MNICCTCPCWPWSTLYFSWRLTIKSCYTDFLHVFTCMVDQLETWIWQHVYQICALPSTDLRRRGTIKRSGSSNMQHTKFIGHWKLLASCGNEARLPAYITVFCSWITMSRHQGCLMALPKTWGELVTLLNIKKTKPSCVCDTCSVCEVDLLIVTDCEWLLTVQSEARKWPLPNADQCLPWDKTVSKKVVVGSDNAK